MYCILFNFFYLFNYKLFKSNSRTRLEFPPMNSYQRLIVHRVAQYFKLSHVVDTSGKAVVLYKSAETQM